MKQRTALLLLTLITNTNITITMNALKTKQDAIAKIPQLRSPQKIDSNEVDANFQKWKNEAENKFKNDKGMQYRASHEGGADVTKYKYIFDEAKPIIEQLGRDIYDQQIAEMKANNNKWPEKYSDLVSNLEKKHSDYMDQLLKLMPANLDITKNGAWESDIIAGIQTMTVYTRNFSKYKNMAQERTKWTQEDIEKKVADEFAAWEKQKTFNSNESKLMFVIEKAYRELLSFIQGPHMFTGLTNKEKVVANAYATNALTLIESLKNKYPNNDHIDTFTQYKLSKEKIEELRKDL